MNRPTNDRCVCEIVKVLFKWSVICLSGFLSFTLAQAQDTDNSEENKSKEVEEVVIVGSRVRQQDLKTISPTQFISREAAIVSGLNSITELLQSTAITGGSSQINNAFGGYVTDGGPGANTISLRGLGASRTLVLINGRRVAPSGTRGSVGTADLNVLPTAMIERVEVLKDGASSIYGSDAISGVINVITRNDLKGLSLEVELNDPTEGEGEQMRFSVSGGLEEERFSLSGSLDYYERKNLALLHRDWTQCNQDLLWDPGTGESYDFIDPNTGKSKCYPITTTGSNGVTINTIGTQPIKADNYLDLGLLSPVVGAPGSSGTTFTRFRPNAAITTGLVGFEGVGGGDNDLNVRNTFERNMLRKSLISPVKIHTAFLQSRYDLQALGNAELYGEFLYSRRESAQTGYRQLTMDYRRGSPVIPSSLAFANFGSDQGTSDGERVGVRAFVGFGNDTNRQAVDYYKPTIGIRGDLSFLPDWKYDGFISYAKSDAEYTSDSFLIDKLTYASDVVIAPSGLDSHLVYGGMTCNINLTNPKENCAPFPMLTPGVIGGNLPWSFRNYIFHEVTGKTKYDESIASFIIDGPVLQLPAGKLQAVLGLEYREVELNDQPDPNSVSENLYNLTSAAPTSGKDNVTEIYTEIEIPILADMPFAKKLSINGSFRYTDYDSYGADDTYKVGAIYSITDWFSIRTTQGTSYRAPALFEQFQGATSGFRSAALDPCNDYGKSPNVSLVANCSSELPGQPDFQATNGVTIYSEGGAAAGLFAETSKNLTYGFVLDPEFGDSTKLSFSMDYFDIVINNGVAKAGEDAILDLCYKDPDFRAGGGFCHLVTRDPQTKQLFVSDAYTNIATEISRGIDGNLFISHSIGPGDLEFDFTVTHYLLQKQELFKGDDVDELTGTIKYPEYGGYGSISYLMDHWKFSYGIDWIGSMDSYKLVEEDPETSIFDLAVPSYFEHRVSVRYIADTWKLTMGVRNLTNETPPEISAGFYNRVGNSPLYSAYDYIGRELFMNLQLDL